MNIGNRISAMRKKKDMSQRALAHAAKISNTTVSRIESDSVVPDTATIEKLATALEVSMKYLIGDVDEIEQKEDRRTP